MSDEVSHFAPQRALFAKLKGALERESDLRDDVLRAFELLLSRYDTRIRENRFIVGGVCERLIGATFVALGCSFKNVGSTDAGFDLNIDGVSLSIKGSFKSGNRDIRLTNVMGSSKKAQWKEPTVFVFSNLGIGYADPEVLPKATKRASDAVILKSASLKAFWTKSPQWLCELPIPTSRSNPDISDVASRIVADEILRYNFKRLRPLDQRRIND
jgi:hypothetical protein